MLCTLLSVSFALTTLPPLSDLLLFPHSRVVDRWRAESREYRCWLDNLAGHVWPHQRHALWAEISRQEAIYRVIDKLDDAQFSNHLLGYELEEIFGFSYLTEYEQWQVLRARLHLAQLREMLGPVRYYSGWVPRPSPAIPIPQPLIMPGAPD